MSIWSFVSQGSFSGLDGGLGYGRPRGPRGRELGDGSALYGGRRRLAADRKGQIGYNGGMSIYFPEEYTSPRPLYQRQGAAMKGRALVALPFGRVVFNNGAGFLLADPITGLFSGVSVRVNTPVGSSAMVLPAGPVEADDWTDASGYKHLVAGKSYFLQNEGKIATTPPEEGAIIRVGRAVYETILLVTFDLKVV